MVIGMGLGAGIEPVFLPANHSSNVTVTDAGNFLKVERITGRSTHNHSPPSGKIRRLDKRPPAVKCDHRGVKLFLSLCLGLALIAPLRAAVDDPPRKRGGFTGATPKPAAKKAAPVESTPAARKKPKPREEDAPAEKKTGASDAPAQTAKPVAPESSGPAPAKQEHAPAATIEPEEIAEFAAQPPRVQALLTAALELTKLNLTYTYGSADPAQGGMDCSGAMYHLLRSQGFQDVPRDSSGQYVWARKAGPFFVVVSKTADGFEFKDLQPGDLLFWTGTYQTSRDIPISHVMLYLGTEKKTKKRIMFGSSDGRSYHGIQRWGVSVFDFKMPNGDHADPEKPRVDFVGYGRIPALRDSAASEPVAEKPPSTPVPVASAATTPKPRSPGKAAGSASQGRKKKRND